MLYLSIVALCAAVVSVWKRGGGGLMVQWPIGIHVGGKAFNFKTSTKRYHVGH